MSAVAGSRQTTDEGSGRGLAVRLRSPLRDFDLEVELSTRPAGRLALVGPSGAGKSTVLRMVAGLARPEDGLIEVAGQTLFDSSAGIDLPPERRQLGFVPQNATLFPHLDAAANVAFGVRYGRSSARRHRAMEMLDRFGLAGMARVHPAQMSGGEAKRVSLARALAAEPSLFLLDEPLSGLDGDTREQVLATLASALDDAAAPVLLVTHSPDEAERLAGRTVRIEKGRMASGISQPSGETNGTAAFDRQLRGPSRSGSIE